MKTFGGIPEKYAGFEDASVLLQSIPYDGTSTWGKGADNGFQAFLEAAENMELYDIETDSEVYKEGIHILPEITEDASPESMFEEVYRQAKQWVETDKFLTFFGGEHSVSIGLIKAFYEKHFDLTVLHLDAHADLRDSYLGSKYNHACALHDASQNTNLIQVGIRSMDKSEKEFMNFNKTYLAEDIYSSDEWMDKAIAQMTDKVYVSLDLDVFDPSIMPATGTPEPGGMYYYDTLRFLKRVFMERDVLGFDIVELAPISSYKAPQFMVAKLYYKLLSYKFCCNE